jgi:hypothetical protein
MATLHASAERVIDAPIEVIYNCIADYNQHHAHILPKEFSDLRVESGSGVGEGTVITFKTKAWGVTQAYRAHVSEPQAGRVLQETNDDGSFSTFTLDAVAGGVKVTIETTFTNSTGLKGIMERLLARRTMESMYARELANLDSYAKSRLAAS